MLQKVGSALSLVVVAVVAVFGVACRAEVCSRCVW